MGKMNRKVGRLNKHRSFMLLQS